MFSHWCCDRKQSWCWTEGANHRHKERTRQSSTHSADEGKSGCMQEPPVNSFSRVLNAVDGMKIEDMRNNNMDVDENINQIVSCLSNHIFLSLCTCELSFLLQQESC